MALAKYGGGIIQLSGSIAGNVFSRNRFGNYVRPRTKPVNPHSARQEAIRSVLSFLAEYWHGELDAAQRANWEVYAAAVPMLNKLGEVIYLTGYNHFVRTNCFALTVPTGIIEDAPGTLSLPEKDIILACSTDDITNQTFTFVISPDGWGGNPDDKDLIGLYQGIPQLASRNFFNGPWRYMSFINAAAGEAGTITSSAVFPFQLGQKVWFQARLMTQSGRLTKLWTLTPKIIADDTV